MITNLKKNKLQEVNNKINKNRIKRRTIKKLNCKKSTIKKKETGSSFKKTKKLHGGFFPFLKSTVSKGYNNIFGANKKKNSMEEFLEREPFIKVENPNKFQKTLSNVVSNTQKIAKGLGIDNTNILKNSTSKLGKSIVNGALNSKILFKDIKSDPQKYMNKLGKSIVDGVWDTEILFKDMKNDPRKYMDKLGQISQDTLLGRKKQFIDNINRDKKDFVYIYNKLIKNLGVNLANCF